MNVKMCLGAWIGVLMREIRILFTGTGRRVELLQAFRSAALCLNVNLKIYGADMAGTAPALAYCNYTRKICAMKDAAYIQQLAEICRQDKIDLVIPTIDTDLLVLSQNTDKFEAVGTRVLISSPNMVALCRDKNYTSEFFESCALKAPMPVNDYREYKGGYPCFIKPKDGSSSIDAYKVNTEAELAMYAGKIGDYIIQPFIEGKEYTIDIFCDFDGSPIYITPRERIAVRSGEVLKTGIELDETIIEESKRLIQRFKPCGPMTVQLIRQNTTGEDYYIEINPRYGGGAPLSIKAGADSASAILKLLQGEKLEYQEKAARNGEVYSRFDQSICIASESGVKGVGLSEITGVIFDLDDTLYSEKQYVKSGYRAVAEFLEREIAYVESESSEEDGLDASKVRYAAGTADVSKEEFTADLMFEKLWNYFLEGKNAIDELLSELERPENGVIFHPENGVPCQSVHKEACKSEDKALGMADYLPKCLEVYRNHMPDIELYDGACALLKELKAVGIKLGIITDGRVKGQKNKIAALGLDELVDDIIITDELGGEQFRKPNDIAFRIMQCRWRLPFEELVYVGDNMSKDFQAQRQLGMRSIYFRNEDGLYYDTTYNSNAGKESMLIDMKIDSLSELYELCKH